MGRITYLLFILFSFCFFIFSFINLNLESPTDKMLDLLVLSGLFIGISIIFGCIIIGVKRRFTLLAYTSSFFVFNLGYYIVNLFDNSYGLFIYGYTSYITYRAEAIGLLIINIGMIAYFISYSIFSIRLKKNNNPLKQLQKVKSENILNNTRIAKKLAKVAMYTGGIFAFIKLGLAIIQVQRFGYSSLYTNISGYSLPILDLFDSFFLIGFLCYIAMMPSTKYLKFPLILFIIYSALTILYGKRGVFLTGILTVVWYLMKRDAMKIDIKELITKQKMMLLIFIGIFLGYLMLIFSQIRLGFGNQGFMYDANIGLLDGLSGMIEQLGFSGRIIPLTVDNESNLKLEEEHWFLFYPVLNYLQNNVLSRLIGFGFENIITIEYLKYSKNFGGWITYLVRPESFHKGGGIGTNYLAEAYISFGFIGVIIINLILGFLLSKMDNLKFDSWKFNAFYLNTFSMLIFMPRSSALGIIPTSVTLIIFILFINYVSRSQKKDIK